VFVGDQSTPASVFPPVFGFLSVTLLRNGSILLHARPRPIAYEHNPAPRHEPPSDTAIHRIRIAHTTTIQCQVLCFRKATDARNGRHFRHTVSPA
jgi:hypothetical protein